MAEIQGLYTAASGMEAQQTQFDAISNDLANSNTPGYESEEVGFQDLLYSSGGLSSGTTAATGAGSNATVVGRDTTEGSLDSTGRSLDVALSPGNAYLEVRRPDGSTALTRNGSLQVDAAGQLTDSVGDPLVPPVTVPKSVNAQDLTISSDGTVSSNGKALGTIKLVTVAAPSQLLADGDSLFSPTTASGGITDLKGASLQQGALEDSNVDMASAMANMVTAERTYDMSSEAVQYQSQMLQIANQLRSGS